MKKRRDNRKILVSGKRYHLIRRGWRVVSSRGFKTEKGCLQSAKAFQRMFKRFPPIVVEGEK